MRPEYSSNATLISQRHFSRCPLTSLSDIPLGHKVALKDFDEGDTVIKYGNSIGKTTAAIKLGEHLHVHNAKTKRW